MRTSPRRALYYVMNQSARAFYRSDCLVIGFGRIGTALTHRLSAMGARVTVAARRENARVRARLFGAQTVNMEEMIGILPQQHFIFNTPPETVLDEAALMKISSGCKLLELASAPYGFDMAMARALGVDAWLESGIPGRFCPESAGTALFHSALRMMMREGGD